jgi:hypothetical protein
MQSECRWTGFRFVGRLFTRQYDGRKFGFRFSPIPKVSAPAEQCTRGKSVRAGDSRDAVPGLFTLQHDSELFLVGEVSAVSTSVACGVSNRCVCQVAFDDRLPSSAASTSAYLRAGTGMKPRSPVNFDLAIIDQIWPGGLDFESFVAAA